MSEENVALIGRLIALANAGDWDAVFELYHDDVEFRDFQHPPDLPEVLYGIEGVRLAAAQWLEPYDDFGAEVYEYVDADPWVICDTRWYGKGKGSDVPTDVRVADAYEIRDGKVLRMFSGYPDVATALGAVRQRASGAAGTS
ncbi:MAG: nuclear transport factor 2 family protein [Actinobacteria bacterium]|nr:MAG: nuclear transport factor 2 family protein [Actinomycetota bacterium]